MCTGAGFRTEWPQQRVDTAAVSRKGKRFVSHQELPRRLFNVLMLQF